MPELKELENYTDQKEATFPVMEIFGPTIQGEGSMIGIKTMFVRFGGCDYRCRMCDSMHAVLPALVKKNANWVTAQDIHDILQPKMKESGTEWVTLSGGNPAMWDLSELILRLHESGVKIAVETQGSMWRDWLGEVDQLTISPKPPGMGERFDSKVFEAFLTKVEDHYNRMMGRLGCCIKIPVFHAGDFELVVGVDAILSHHNSMRGNVYWPECDRYLSLGNDFVPQVIDGQIVDNAIDQMHEQHIVPANLKEYLLWKYKLMLGDFLQDPRIGHWKFLPQLHVLVWDNKAGV